MEFVRTFLERDIPQLEITVPAAAMRRFWPMLMTASPYCRSRKRRVCGSGSTRLHVPPVLPADLEQGVRDPPERDVAHFADPLDRPMHRIRCR